MPTSTPAKPSQAEVRGRSKITKRNTWGNKRCGESDLKGQKEGSMRDMAMGRQRSLCKPERGREKKGKGTTDANGVTRPG